MTQGWCVNHMVRGDSRLVLNCEREYFPAREEGVRRIIAAVYRPLDGLPHIFIPAPGEVGPGAHSLYLD